MPKRILVVDDEEHMRELLKIALNNSGYEVEIYKNGQDALTRIESDGPTIGLIVTDYQMPIIKGTTLAAIAFDLAVPCVLMSGNEEPAEHKALYFLKKPFDLSRLLHVVETLI